MATIVTTNDDAAFALENFDTGQLAQLDTGQLEEVSAESLLAYASASADEKLAVTFHEIHRYDQEGAQRELITSTLKYFSIEVALQDAAGGLLYHLDGTSLAASLVYDNGWPVEALSATLEPPLLAAAGECAPKAVLEGGTATFRLRITVLSSLCNKHQFRVKVRSVERPELECVSAPTKTITKLHRGVRQPAGKGTPTKTIAKGRAPVADENGGLAGGGAGGAKRPLCGGDELGCLKELTSCDVEESALCDALSDRSLDELWDQVSLNGARLLELQAQQRKLFKELRALKADD